MVVDVEVDAVVGREVDVDVDVDVEVEPAVVVVVAGGSCIVEPQPAIPAVNNQALTDRTNKLNIDHNQSLFLMLQLYYIADNNFTGVIF